MGRKIARGFGTAVCALLFVLCAFMIIVSAVFGSSGLVGAFGYNMFLCERSDFEGLNSGAAVIVEQCEPYDLTEGNLILYTVSDGEDSEAQPEPVLAYLEAISMSDGVYTLTVSDANGNESNINERALVGKAGWSSDILGGFISFVVSPWGVCVMAVLPCLALIIYAVLKGVIDERPLPEVVPQRKNSEPDEKAIAASLGMKPDGNAQYSRSTGGKPAQTADSVLFTYGSSKPKSPAAMKPSAPAAEAKKSSPAAIKPEAPEKSASDKVDVEFTKPKPKVASEGGVPSSVAAKRYLDSTTAAQKKTNSNATAPKSVEAAAKLSDATAEIPQIPKKKKSDAFFAQSDAPQIGRKADPRNRAVIELEDALASAHEKREPARKSAEPAGKRSADILAAKSRDELIVEDDDSRDRNRYDVDDILAGLDRRRRS